MYVWIPRYKYELFNVDGGDIPEQEIKIEFEEGIGNTGDIKCEYTNNGDGSITENCTNKITKTPAQKGNWYTHPAFTFKGTLEESGTELTGIWVGKFESSGDTNNLKIIPNVRPLLSVNINYMFNAARNIDELYSNKYKLDSSAIDTHMAKNIEWGVVAYLTQTNYGRCPGGTCEEVSRNTTEYTTGYGSQPWSTENGVLASTTGNIYGIYDTNGGAWEYVMANTVNNSGEYNPGSSGLNPAPASKYYDVYANDTSYYSHDRGHLGDATRETMKTFGAEWGAWYDAYPVFAVNSYPWFERGGRTGDTIHAGTFAFNSNTGAAVNAYSFRVVMTRDVA